jgi:hypothetical protein
MDRSIRQRPAGTTHRQADQMQAAKAMHNRENFAIKHRPIRAQSLAKSKLGERSAQSLKNARFQGPVIEEAASGAGVNTPRH